MKGYFASLAKQSGVRVSGQKPGARVSPATAEGSFPAPLHREETVMVPASREGGRIENTMTHGPAQKADSPKTGTGAVSVDPQPQIFIEKAENIIRAEETGTASEPAKVEAVSRDVPLLPETRALPNPRPADEQRVSAEANPVREITVAEQSVDREDASTIPLATPDKPEPYRTVIAETVEKPTFFVKTAKIIERGDAGAEDIGSILFQEVRQWVASGPSEADAPDQRESEAVEMPTVEEISRMPPDPGVVVVGDRNDRESSTEPAALEEQNFNLSIGTISVIIEDSGRPAESTQTVQTERPQNAPSGTKREFSRLNRSYL